MSTIIVRPRDASNDQWLKACGVMRASDSSTYPPLLLCLMYLPWTTQTRSWDSRHAGQSTRGNCPKHSYAEYPLGWATPNALALDVDLAGEEGVARQVHHFNDKRLNEVNGPGWAGFVESPRPHFGNLRRGGGCGCARAPGGGGVSTALCAYIPHARHRHHDEHGWRRPARRAPFEP